MINRRDFFKRSSLIALGGLMAGKLSAAESMSNAMPSVAETAGKKKIGLQIYSLFNELYEGDLDANLKKLAQMGYTDLELAGYNNGKLHNMTLPEFKKHCDGAGLKIVSSHVNPPVREYTKDNFASIQEYWKKTAADHAEIGCKFLIQPGLPSTRSIEETKYVCEVFNEAGKIVKAAGPQFGYHNHDMEFSRVEEGGKEPVFGRRARKGEYIYDLFLKNTDKNLVVFEMDVYWTVMGQQDPVAYMRNYADRIRALHIKDSYILGQSGEMNFPNIFTQAYKNGIQDFFVEIEQAPSNINLPKGYKQFQAAAESAKYLLAAKFVK